jgi:hypothetical protein
MSCKGVKDVGEGSMLPKHESVKVVKAEGRYCAGDPFLSFLDFYQHG